MKNGIRSTLVSKRSFFLCFSLLACGSIGGTFTTPIADQHPDASRTDIPLPKGNVVAAAPKPAISVAPSAAHGKASATGSAMPSFRNTISGDEQDADSRFARRPVSMPVAGEGFGNGGTRYFDTLQASSAPDQTDDAQGNGVPGGAFGGATGGAFGGTAGGIASGGVQGVQPSSGLAAVTPAGGCLASPGMATTLPLGAGGCFVSGGENSGGQDDIIAQADTGTDTDMLPPTVRQSNLVRPGQGGGGGGGGNTASGGPTTPTAGPSAPNSPPPAPPGAPPNAPPGAPPPPIVVDITPFTSNSFVDIIPTTDGLPNFTPAADPPGGTSVPEPATVALVFLGFAGLLVARSRKS